MSLIKYIQNKFELNPFIVEILYKNGYTTKTKLMLINPEIVPELMSNVNKNIDKYVYFKNYNTEIYDKYLEAKHNGKDFIVNLLTGDMNVLCEIPNMMKSIPNEDLPKSPKPITFNYKRRNDENTPSNASSNIDLPRTVSKKMRLELDISILDERFTTFVTKLDPGLSYAVVTQLEGNPIFTIICPKCQKSIRIGYKVTKSSNPLFVKTNWMVHSCNKISSSSEIPLKVSASLEE